VYPLPIAGALWSGLAAPFRFRARFFEALWNALTGARESPRARAAGIWHLFVACHWAAALRRDGVKQIHSQWIHSGGTVAMYGAWLLGVPFSFTGHAADLLRERAALDDKIRRADFIVCISSFHRKFFLEHGARPEQLVTVYCGIDTKLFSPGRRKREPNQRYRILSAGRLVEKKGFEWVIRAGEILKQRGIDFECVIGGSGPLEADLRRQVEKAGLSDRVEITGQAIKQEEIPGFMHAGDVYCLPCVWAEDNDVDGLPQMLMEAMACGLPVVSTRLVGIPDLVIDGKTGLLVEPNQAEPLADALERLYADPDLAERLAAAGREHVLRDFDLSTCLTPLLERYRARLEAS
jgi:glycosyltransferase involved in cell wall biosynthesis